MDDDWYAAYCRDEGGEDGLAYIDEDRDNEGGDGSQRGRFANGQEDAVECIRGIFKSALGAGGVWRESCEVVAACWAGVGHGEVYAGVVTRGRATSMSRRARVI